MEAPAPISSASLHPEKDFFVAGGEDFKLYKFDYSTKEELGEEHTKIRIHISVTHREAQQGATAAKIDLLCKYWKCYWLGFFFLNKMYSVFRWGC